MKKNPADLQFAEGETLLLYKPYGWSSFAVVAQLKKWTKAKIGHAGTLDPLAEGLMICCTGKFTKKLTALTGLDKTYTGIIRLGEKTATYDLESVPEKVADSSSLREEEIEQAVQQFRGKITQYPPIHSAIKQAGKPVYELAREGKEVVMKSREILIHQFDFNIQHLPDLSFEIRCASGTYIRSIANDLGTQLGVGGYLKSLVRTQIGEYNVKDAYTIDELADFFGTKMNARIILPKVSF